MENCKNTIVIFLISALFLLVSCVKNTDDYIENEIIKEGTLVTKTKAEKLAEVVFNTVDDKCGIAAPKIISAAALFQSLNENILVIDIRNAKDFANGHIKNSKNLKMSELMDYAQVNGLHYYDKVVMVCYTGQTASYSSAILQMLGNENVHILEWGMCGWNKKFNIKWNKSISDDGIDNLVTKEYPKHEVSALPKIESRSSSGEEILKSRARAMLKSSFGKSAITFETAEGLAITKKAYVICCQCDSTYKKGHIVNSVLYNQKKAFDIKTDLLTLPRDKTIVVYSDKSLKSAFITVYLKMLGYKAKTLKYGANCFMNSKLRETEAGFSQDKIIDYPYETSEYIEVVGEVMEGGC